LELIMSMRWVLLALCVGGCAAPTGDEGDTRGQAVVGGAPGTPAVVAPHTIFGSVGSVVNGVLAPAPNLAIELRCPGQPDSLTTSSTDQHGSFRFTVRAEIAACKFAVGEAEAPVILGSTSAYNFTVAITDGNATLQQR
jgi:hypothetical protein